jgi:hypothetical protein
VHLGELANPRCGQPNARAFCIHFSPTAQGQVENKNYAHLLKKSMETEENPLLKKSMEMEENTTNLPPFNALSESNGSHTS